MHSLLKFELKFGADSTFKFQDVTADIIVASTCTLKAITSFEMRLYVQVMSWIQMNTAITLQQV